MSYDFDVRPSPCDHYQRRERVIISSSDYRTLVNYINPNVYMNGILSAASSVKVRMGGQYIPSNHPTYGWSVQPDTSSMFEKRFKIVFNNQNRMTGLIMELEYFCTQASCLKCNGYGNTTDFTESNLGVYIHVTEHNKLIQRANKFLLSSKCDFYPGFTSQLKTFIGRKFGVSLTEDDISQEIVNSLENLRNIQLAQATVQTLSPQETLRNVESVTSVVDSTDPTLVTSQATISSYGPTRPNPLTFVLRTNNQS